MDERSLSASYLSSNSYLQLIMQLIARFGGTYHPGAVVVRVRGQPVVPGQRKAGGGRQGGAVAAAADFHAAGGGVTAAGQHPVPKQLLDVAEAVLLHLDVARGVREGERGCAQLQGAARVGRGNGGGRVHMET